MAKTPLVNWVDDAIRDVDQDGPCTMLALVHMPAKEEVKTVRLNSGQPRSPKEIAEMFLGCARMHAQDLAGVQTYNLLAFYGTSKEPTRRQPFAITPELDYNGMGTEPPDERGQTMQSMRQREAIFQQVFRRQQQLDEYSTNLIREQGMMIRNLMHENVESFDIVKKLISERALDEHNHRMKEQEYIRQTEERKLLIKFGPPLINTILGREVFPQNTADTALVETIAEKLSEEDIKKLAMVLPQELLGPIMARFEGVLKDKRLKAEQMKQLTAGTTAEHDGLGESH